MTRGSLLILACLGACLGMGLTACGTGADPRPAAPAPSGGDAGGGGSGGGAAKPTHVLVRPAEGEDIEEIVQGSGAQVVQEIEGTPFFVVKIPPGGDVDAFLDGLQGDTRVMESEPDRQLASPEGGGATLPLGGDFFEFQIADQPEFLRIGATEARSRATGAGVRVAVIDSGVDPTHASLLGRIEPGGWDFVDGDPDPTDERNFADDDGDGLVDEGFGHGTFVSSLILALAPDARILPFRVLDSDSNGLASSVAQAIIAAANAHVDVINLSLGMEHRVLVVGEAVKYARQQGVAVVVSSGNTGQEEVTYPASISAAFSVTGVDALDVLAPFASFGSDVDVSAPGVDLIGAYPTAPNAAVKWSGTSFSAALVTGTFALVRELAPAASGDAVLQQIAQSSVDVEVLNALEVGGEMGRGRLDAGAATLLP